MSVSIAGSCLLPAAAARVWTALQDVDCLALCVPGCETLSRLSPEHYAVAAVVPIGPVRVAVEGTVTVTGRLPGRRLTLAGRGGKRLLGSAAGTARIDLVEVRGGCCRLRWEVKALPEGPFTALGPSVMASIATAFAQRFLDRLAAVLAAPAGPPPSEGLNAPASYRRR